MALKPSDMTPPEEVANHDFVSRLETEMDDWLLTQEKGKREYMNTWDEYVSPVNLDELISRYEEAGWEASAASDKDQQVTTLTLRRTVASNPWQPTKVPFRDKVPFLRDPVVGSSNLNRVPETTLGETKTDPAQLPE